MIKCHLRPQPSVWIMQVSLFSVSALTGFTVRVKTSEKTIQTTMNQPLLNHKHFSTKYFQPEICSTPKNYRVIVIEKVDERLVYGN